MPVEPLKSDLFHAQQMETWKTLPGLPIHKIILIVCSPTNSGWPLHKWMLTTSGSMFNASRFNYDMSPTWNPLNGEVTPSEYERAFRITVDKVTSAWPETCSLLGLTHVAASSMYPKREQPEGWVCCFGFEQSNMMNIPTKYIHSWMNSLI